MEQERVVMKVVLQAILIHLLCAFGSAIASMPNLASSDAVEDAASLGPCIFVDINTLFDDPISYMGEVVCTRAYIRVEYEAMELLPTQTLNEPGAYELGIDLRHDAAVVQGLRSFDHVVVRGRLARNPSCLPGVGLCWGAPVSFIDPEVRVLDRPGPRETCTHVPIDDLLDSSRTFWQQMICTEGVLTHAHIGLTMRSANALENSGNANQLDVSTIHVRDRSALRLPGERISVAGYFTGTHLYAFEIRVLEERHIAEYCVETTIAEVLASSQDFNNVPICIGGFVSSIEPGYGILDEKSNIDATTAAATRIYTLLPAAVRHDLPLDTRARLTLRGVIAVDEYEVNTLSFDELEARYAADPIFPVANTPLTLIVYDVESTPGSHTCTSVSIEDLYRDPTPYIGQRICTNGMVHVAYEGMALYGEGMDPTELIDVRIFPPFDYDDAIGRSISSGDQLTVEGVFTVNQECLDGIDPVYPDDEPFFCIPIRLPAWFDDANYEVIDGAQE